MPNHRIYLASSWRNQYQPAMVETLRSWGHEVYDFRHPAPGDDGFSWADIDQHWESWTVTGYRRALWNPLAEEGFASDMLALYRCEVVVLLLPCGRSSHSEAAWHAGRGEPVIAHIPEPCEPELMYKMFNAITNTEDELKTLLSVHSSQIKQMVLCKEWL